jgi:dihydroorotate dehydrogenase (fumarate)
MTDLSVDLCGLRLKSPLVLASGPLAWNAASIRSAFQAGAAAVVSKTIRPQTAVNPVPHIAVASAGRQTLLNTERWSDLPAKQWIDEELPSLADRRGIVIASTGHTPAEVEQLAGPLSEAGADLLELVSYNAQDAEPMVVAAKRVASIPVLVKVSAKWPHLDRVVGSCVEAGADGVTAIDSIGPALQIDVETGRPLLGSFAWLSGQAIRPIALAAVAKIALQHGVPVVGTGGVGRAEHVVEMIMAGATAVGVHTVPLLQGLEWFGKTSRQLESWLDRRGWTQLTDLRGAALPHLDREPFTSNLRFTFNPEICTRCERCVTVCAYQARTLLSDGGMHLDELRCRACGLCTSSCPTAALRAQQEM